MAALLKVVCYLEYMWRNQEDACCTFSRTLLDQWPLESRCQQVSCIDGSTVYDCWIEWLCEEPDTIKAVTQVEAKGAVYEN